MTNFLQLIAEISIILVAAKAAGYLSTRLKQPSVFGELLVGVLLGPSLLDITHLGFVTNTHLAETIHEFGEIGVLLLMFLAGLELHIKELTKNTRVALLAGVMGVLLPVGLGILFGEFLNIPFSHALFLGLTLGATSVSISAQVLIELQVLRTRVGLGLLGAAVFDDILVILILSSAVAFLSGGGSFTDILWVFARMVIYLALATAVGLWLLPRVVRFTQRLKNQPGAHHARACRAAWIRSGSGTDRRHGSHHGNLPGRLDVRQNAGKIGHRVQSSLHRLRVLRAHFLRQHRSQCEFARAKRGFSLGLPGNHGHRHPRQNHRLRRRCADGKIHAA